MTNPLTGNWWANLDFETRSCLDLPQVGAHLYAAHPSTEVICLRYSICGGEKIHEWFPGWPLPADLEMGILQAGRMEAWNAAFERLIWHHIMVKRHNAPAVDMEQWVCTMVRAYLQGFPGKLDAAGPSMGLGITKDAKGHSVMMQVAKPRRRKGGVLWTESDPGFTEVRAQAHPPGTFVGGLPAEFTYFMHDGQETVAQWWVDHDRIKTVVDYCAQDVAVESAASVFLDPMPPKEHKGWCLDQRINDRGFYIDLDFVGKARAAIRPATDAANHELIRLTNGQLRSVTKPNEIRAWINAELGLELDSIDKDTLNILLVEHENMPDVVREVIELRMAAAKTSTAKMNAMVRGTGSDWIFRGGLQYAGAGRTNRWAGRRLQPHNFPRPPKWATQAIPYIQAGRIDHVALLFGTPLEAISAVLRSCITARPGYELHVADYNAIEARIVAWYAQAARILNAFRTGDDPYRIQAASVYGVQDWRDIPKDSDERMLGKKIILGCFTAETRVLTRRGAVPILSLQPSDMVWDGDSWVSQDGVIYQGQKRVVEYAGVRATPDHKVLTPDGWQPIHRVRDASTTYRQSVHALANSPCAGSISAHEGESKLRWCHARVALPPLTHATYTIYSRAPLPAAAFALSRPVPGLERNCTDTLKLCLTIPTGSVGLPAGMASGVGATGRAAKPTLATVGEASSWQKSGMIKSLFCETFRVLTAGKTRCWSWIESMLTATTRRATSAWLPALSSLPTPADQLDWSTTAGSIAPTNSPGSVALSSPPPPFTAGSRRACPQKTASPASTSQEPVAVYDVLNAGPRNRFTILTDDGPLVVHNCGFGMGKDRFWSSCREDGLFISKHMAKQAVDAYRADNPEIPRAWYELDQAAISAFKAGGQGISCLEGKVTFWRDTNFLRCRLASGRVLSYLYPRIRQRETPWGAMRDALEFWGWNGQKNRMEWQTMYGGRWMENCLALGTKVLSSRGWVSIETVGIDDLVHDGIDFVPHQGLVAKGNQLCTDVDGVLMTPDHEVLTDEGWQAASQNPRPYRPDLRDVDIPAPNSERWAEAKMVDAMPVRSTSGEGGHRRGEGVETRPDARVPHLRERYVERKADNTRPICAPGLSRVEVHARSVSTAITSCMGKLRRAWHSCVRAVGQLREFLGRYGANLPAGFDAGSPGQRHGLQPRELSMGYICPTGGQPKGANSPTCRHIPSTQTDGSPAVNSVRPLVRRPVFDILNAGPRQRFVVLGEEGPFVVHNCVQATARDVMLDSMLRLDGLGWDIILTVHDEELTEAPIGAKRLPDMVDAMETPPHWAPDLPLKVEGWTGFRYKK